MPSFFVTMESMPLTSNGKLDRKALPKPDGDRPALESGYVAPSTNAEQALVAIWEEVLNVRPIGVHDNFFSLGGDSIRSIRVRAFAEKQGIRFAVKDLFQHATVHELSRVASAGDVAPLIRLGPLALLAESDRTRIAAIPEIEDAFPVTKMQGGMLFHMALEPESAVYHNLNTFNIETDLQLALFRETLARCAARHEMLRTSFDLTSFSEPLQLVHRAATIPFAAVDFSQLPAGEQDVAWSAWVASEKMNKFDFRNPPLARVTAVFFGGDAWRITLTEHHAIMDGWSVASLMTEVFATYFALVRGEAPASEPIAASNADYVALERAALESDEHRAWFAKVLDEVVALPVAGWNALWQVEEAAGMKTHRVLLPVEVSDSLRTLARGLGVPIKSIALAAHLSVLALFTANRDVTTGYVTNGRPETADGERLLGLFLNTLPVRARTGVGTWRDLIADVFAYEQQLMTRRHYPFAQLQKERGGAPLFHTVFNYIHFHVYQQLASIREMNLTGGTFFEETNFELSTIFGVDPTGSRMMVTLEYDSAVFASAQIDAIGRAYLEAFETIT
ncbi:MAG TPA: condensation domain-containing protein, partial [Thermoanaerobaculia bacterium]